MMDFNQHLTKKGHGAEMPPLNRKTTQWQQCRADSVPQVQAWALVNVCFMTAGDFTNLILPTKCLPAHAYEPVNEHTTHTHTHANAHKHMYRCTHVQGSLSATVHIRGPGYCPILRDSCSSNPFFHFPPLVMQPFPNSAFTHTPFGSETLILPSGLK